MNIKALTAAVTVALSMVAAANAATVSITQTQVLTEDGQDMFFNFDGLAPSDGSGGTVTIASGIARNAPSWSRGAFNGLDLDEPEEYFDLTLDGEDRDRWNCTGHDYGFDISHPSVRKIPGSVGSDNCVFELVVSLDDAFLDDGLLTVGVLFSEYVDYYNNALGGGGSVQGDEVIVTLNYTAAPVSEVPNPAALPLFMAGLAGLGFAGRGRKALP